MAAYTGGKRELNGNEETQMVKKKKCRVDNCFLSVDHIHINFTPVLLINIAEDIRDLIDESSLSFVKLTPLKMFNSNAVDGCTFSRAWCRIEEYDNQYSFVCMFMKGLKLLMRYLDTKEMPGNPQENLVLDTLLHYLIDVDAQTPLQNLNNLSETDLPIILANHLFGRLAPSSEFLINRQWIGKRDQHSCPCSKTTCKMTGRYGDSSIGNGTVWHGNVDVIINNQAIVVTPEDELGSPAENSTLELKQKSSPLTRNSQVIAESIVFSFLQKKKHPENSHYIFPCVAVSAEGLVVYLYDAEHDVLLESTVVSLHNTNTSTGISLVAIVVSWLVVNYTYLCNGLTEDLKNKNSGFFCQADTKLSVYENDLRLGDIVPSQTVVQKSLQLVPDPVAKGLNEKRLKTILEKHLAGDL